MRFAVNKPVALIIQSKSKTSLKLPISVSLLLNFAKEEISTG